MCVTVYSEKQKCACLQQAVTIVQPTLCFRLAVTQALHLDKKTEKEKTTPFGVNLMQSQVIY